MAMKLADETGADLVIATDPDCDRMGIAARDAAGKMTLLTGNQIGSLMAWYRAMKHFEKGILNDGNKSHGVIIKTFVTTDLQKAIAEKSGIRCVETLTGFKYIGEKLRKYEEKIPAELRNNYSDLSEDATRKLRLAAFLALCVWGRGKLRLQRLRFRARQRRQQRRSDDCRSRRLCQIRGDHARGPSRSHLFASSASISSAENP